MLDFVPETVYRVARHFNKAKTTIPIIYVKVGADKRPHERFHYHFKAVFPASEGVCGSREGTGGSALSGTELLSCLFVGRKGRLSFIQAVFL